VSDCSPVPARSEKSAGDPGPAEVVPVDVVPTEAPVRRKRKRKCPQHIRKHNEVLKVRSVALSERLRDLRLDNPSWPLKRVAAELGIHPVHASRLWSVWVKRAEASGSPQAIGEVRAYLEGKLLRVVEICEARIDENASYAAGTLKALEMWGRLRGVDLSDLDKGDGDSRAGELSAIAESARTRAVSVLSVAPPSSPPPPPPAKS